MKDLAKESFDYGSSYLKSIETIYRDQDRRFNNDLLYNMIAISYEKFMIGLLATYDMIANSHLPLMMFREVRMVDPDFNEDFKRLAILIGSFEGICSIDDFGYRTPTDSQVETMTEGLKVLQSHVAPKVEAMVG